LHECRVVLWNVAITPSGHKSNEALGFSLEKRLRRSKGNCLRGEKKKRCEFPVGRAVKFLAVHRAPRLCTMRFCACFRYIVTIVTIYANFRFKWQSLSRTVSLYPVTRVARNIAERDIRQIKKYLYAPLSSILNLFPFLI